MVHRHARTVAWAHVPDGFVYCFYELDRPFIPPFLYFLFGCGSCTHERAVDGMELSWFSRSLLMARARTRACMAGWQGVALGGRHVVRARTRCSRLPRRVSGRRDVPARSRDLSVSCARRSQVASHPLGVWVWGFIFWRLMGTGATVRSVVSGVLVCLFVHHQISLLFFSQQKLHPAVRPGHPPWTHRGLP